MTEIVALQGPGRRPFRRPLLISLLTATTCTERRGLSELCSALDSQPSHPGAGLLAAAEKAVTIGGIREPVVPQGRWSSTHYQLPVKARFRCVAVIREEVSDTLATLRAPSTGLTGNKARRICSVR